MHSSQVSGQLCSFEVLKLAGSCIQLDTSLLLISFAHIVGEMHSLQVSGELALKLKLAGRCIKLDTNET